MRVMVTGHRPDALGGYFTPNPVEQWVRTTLRSVLEGMLKREPKMKAITGMALGSDQIFAEVCVELGIPFTSALAFQGQDGRWPDHAKARYNSLLRQATKVVVVDEIPAYHSDHFGGKMALQNKWMVDHSDQAIAIWNGSTDGGTYNAIRDLRRRDRKILRINPSDRVVGVDEPDSVESGPNILDFFRNRS